MSGRKRNNKKLIVEKVAGFFDIPTAAFPWGMDMEILNDRDLYVGGCTGISEYSETKVVFCGKDMKIIADGNDFELYTFADGRVRLAGKLDAIHIERAE